MSSFMVSSGGGGVNALISALVYIFLFGNIRCQSVKLEFYDTPGSQYSIVFLSFVEFY